MFKDFIDNEKYLTDKFTGHKYLDTYNEVLSSRKDSTKNVLEIGVSAGGSILLWRDFFQNANIYGIDIDDKPQSLINDSMTRISFIKQNAYDVNFVQSNFIDKNIRFDLIVDDGPHSLESMKFFAEHYSRILNNGGVLVIEDIPSIDWCPQIINHFSESLRNKARVVDLRPIQNRWDDIMIVYEP